MLTPADVKTAYLLILGRCPESDQVIRSQIKNAETFERLRDVLLTSAEFVERVKTDLAVRAALYPATVAMVSAQPSERYWKAVALLPTRPASEKAKDLTG